MRLPPFEYLEPKNLDEALGSLDEFKERAALLAGGTDLIVRMKQRLETPSYLIGLKSLDELRYIVEEGDIIRIGSLTTLNEILQSSIVQKSLPGLIQAISSIGAPTIQHFRGTIGGNLCQNTRCLFYNQSAFWRSGRQACHKAGGQICYAEENSDRCRSANQSDGATALMALGASAVLKRKTGERTLSLDEFFTGKGEAPLALEPDEILTEIQIPYPPEASGSSYEKLNFRSAIDYPLVSSAVSLTLQNGKIGAIRIVIGAVAASPLFLRQVSETLVGANVKDQHAIDRAARDAMDQASAFPVENLGSSAAYRSKMAQVLVRRGIEKAAATVGSSR